MSTWRKRLFWLIVVTLVICTLVFWGTMAGGCYLLALVLGFQMFLFNNYASSDLAKTFEECGLNVRGWRN